jgi:cell surface protein SprA
MENENGFGFVRDVTNENRLIPSSGYDIANATLMENFAPFIGIDFALKNSFTGTIKYNRQRNITLNITSLQIAEIYNNEFVFGIGYIIKDFDMLIKLKSNQVKRVKNDLTMRLDFSIKDLSTLLRKIDTDEPPQATAGNKTIAVKFTADYVFSSKLNFRFFFDYQSNTPLITTSYPMSVINSGLSIKFMLTR